MSGKTPRIGVLVDVLGDPYQAAICEGIQQGAFSAGANLMLFVGGTLPADPAASDHRYELYDLAGRHNLDALILLSSTLSHHVGPAGIAKLTARYSGLPLCSVGLALTEVPSITVNNAAGMANVVRHLIEEHRARRIAFITGPDANLESEVRTDAYRAILARHELPFDAALLVPGNFSMESGVAAVRTLLERLGPRLDTLDAIVAANDNMAIGALDALAKLEPAIRSRIAVAGFDDIEEARLTEPSLTTARQPLVRIGLEAARLVLLPQRPEGDRELRLNTELVLRDSCGCTRRPAPTPRNAEAGRQSFNIAFLGQRERVLAQLSRAARGLLIGAGSNWAEQLLYALVDDLGSGSYDRFVPLVERIIAQLRAGSMDLTCIDDIISVLRDELVPLLRGEADKYKHAEDLFQAVRLATSAAIQRSQGRAHLELTRWARTIAVVCNAIASASGFAELEARIREYLPQIGMHGCFVVVYTTPGDSSYGQVVASHDTSERREDLVGRPFRPQRLLPEGVDLYSGERCFAVLPLLGQNVVLGHVLFEYTPRHAFACKVLADAISIVVHAAPKLEGEAGGPPSVVFPSQRR